jgi:hypothetical protein
MLWIQLSAMVLPVGRTETSDGFASAPLPISTPFPEMSVKTFPVT